MPAIFELQCLVLASSSRAWPAPTTLNLMVDAVLALFFKAHTACLTEK
ncbi:MAG: hypothetical protein RLZZ419_1382 [Pseudomonadota bacterium]